MCADFTTFERGVAAFDLRRSWLAKAKANLKKTRLANVKRKRLMLVNVFLLFINKEAVSNRIHLKTGLDPPLLKICLEIFVFYQLFFNFNFLIICIAQIST